MTLPVVGYVQQVEVVVGGTLPRAGYVQPVESASGLPFITGSGAAGQVTFWTGPSSVSGSSSLLWDNPNKILKIGSEGAVEIATTVQPFRTLTGHYTSNGVIDPYISIGYNIAGGNAAASNPITPGVEQLQISLEAKWNPVGTYNQAEFNHDYWSADGLTHRRAFLHFIRDDTFVGTWNWFAGSYFWANSDNSATFMRMDANALTYTGNSITLGTLIATGTTNICNNSANPTVVLNCSTSAANNRLWDIFLSGTVMEFRLVNDADSAATDWMSVSRTANTVNNITFGGPILWQDGTIGTPAAAFASQTALGYFKAATGVMGLNGQLAIANTGTVDTIIKQDAANTIAFVNGASAQTVRIYGTTTGSRYLILSHNATDALITTDGGGNSSLKLGVNTSGNFAISNASGSFYPLASLATNMVNGFINIPGAAGAPIGTPTTTIGYPFYYDQSSKKLYIYDAGWKKGQVAAVDVVYA